MYPKYLIPFVILDVLNMKLYLIKRFLYNLPCLKLLDGVLLLSIDLLRVNWYISTVPNTLKNIVGT